MMGATRAAKPALLAAALVLAALGALGCSNDPVPQAAIDALPEESGTASALHRPGEPCVLCHSAYEGALPELAIGGTVFALDSDGKPQPAVNVYVTITDSAGDFRGICTNGAGNFFVERENWTEIAFPLTSQVGDRGMRSLIGRDGSCATCHRLPDENSLVPATGASRDSAGVILVDLSAPDPNCGGL